MNMCMCSKQHIYILYIRVAHMYIYNIYVQHTHNRCEDEDESQSYMCVYVSEKCVAPRVTCVYGEKYL